MGVSNGRGVVVVVVAPVSLGRSVVVPRPSSAVCVCEPGSADRTGISIPCGWQWPVGVGPLRGTAARRPRASVAPRTVLCHACAEVVTSSGAAVLRLLLCLHNVSGIWPNPASVDSRWECRVLGSGFSMGPVSRCGTH